MDIINYFDFYLVLVEISFLVLISSVVDNLIGLVCPCILFITEFEFIDDIVELRLCFLFLESRYVHIDRIVVHFFRLKLF